MPRIPCLFSTKEEDGMKKIAILGFENSHAWSFSEKLAPKDGVKTIEDMELIGCYADLSTEDGQIGKENILKRSSCDNFADSFDAFVDQVDAVMITSRHGKFHLPFAVPYLKKGIPVWVDKPICTSTEDAVELVKLAKHYGAPITGGSSLKFSDGVVAAAEYVKANSGKITGGHVSAPVNMVNPYGNFWFYSQHLIQMMISAFGYEVRKVTAWKEENAVRVLFEYDDYKVTGHFGAGYTLTVYSGNWDAKAFTCTLDNCFTEELMEFVQMVRTGKGVEDYREFIAPVFIIDAIIRSFESGETVEINLPEV